MGEHFGAFLSSRGSAGFAGVEYRYGLRDAGGKAERHKNADEIRREGVGKPGRDGKGGEESGASLTPLLYGPTPESTNPWKRGDLKADRSQLSRDDSGAAPAMANPIAARENGSPVI